MTGAIAAMLGAGSAGGSQGGGVIAPAALAWNDIYGEDSGSTQTLEVTGVTAPIQITANRTGGGTLNYILNGAFAPYTGALVVGPGDTLAWAISITGSTDRSGVVTVNNSSAAGVIDSFNYLVYSSRGVRQ